MVPEFYVKRGVSASYVKVNTAFEASENTGISCMDYFQFYVLEKGSLRGVCLPKTHFYWQREACDIV